MCEEREQDALPPYIICLGESVCVDGKERVTKMLNDTRQIPPGHLCDTFLCFALDGKKKFLKVWNYKATCVLTGSLEILNINVFMSCRATLM